MLISILLPSLQKARQAAYSTACLSNLRVLGQAVSIYANYNKGSLPPSAMQTSSGLEHMGSILVAQLGVGNGLISSSDPATSRARGVLFCKAGITGNTQDKAEQNTYSAHPLLMPDMTLNYPAGFPHVPNPTKVQRKPYRLAFVHNPSEVVLLFDGAQNTINGNANYDGRMIDNQRISDTSNTNPGVTYLLTSSGVDLSQSIDGGPNQDAPADSPDPTTKVFANIRWRHGRNNIANFLFLDGHSESRHYNSRFNTEILRRNVYVPNQW